MAIILCHTADHGCRVPLVNRYVKLSLNSTLEGSILTLTCENEKLMSTTNATNEQVLEVIVTALQQAGIQTQLISLNLAHR